MSWQGKVESVHYATEAGSAMTSPESIEAVAGYGVTGDRYAKQTGTFSHIKEARRQITLFEAEVLDTIARDHNVRLDADECRMNIVTRGAPLAHLVGVRFRVGDAILHGLKLNEPCARLNEVTGKRVIKALIHRCGLFAEVIETGRVRPADSIHPLG